VGLPISGAYIPVSNELRGDVSQ